MHKIRNMTNARRAKLKAQWEFSPLSVKIGRGLVTGAPIIVLEYQMNDVVNHTGSIDGFPVAVVRIIKERE